MNRLLPRAVLATAGLIATAGALAIAEPGRAQVDTRSTEPIDITADQAEVTSSKCLAVWRGAAEALQGQTRLRADTISVYTRPKGSGANGQPACGSTERIVAEGNVYYVTPQQNVRGDRAVYSQGADEIVVTGDVIIVQGNDVARGDKLTINVATHEARMESRTTGAGRPGRVRGVFYPDRNSQNGEPAQAGSLKPQKRAP
ncbi:MAG: LptA/OstA family protein [Caulobacteraceae bacterium]